MGRRNLQPFPCHDMEAMSCAKQSMAYCRSIEERELNARYVVSAARKMGCSMPLLWEDIAEARSPKTILAFIAAVLVHETRKLGA